MYLLMPVCGGQEGGGWRWDQEGRGYKVELEITMTAKRNSGAEELSHVYKSN